MSVFKGILKDLWANTVWSFKHDRGARKVVLGLAAFAVLLIGCGTYFSKREAKREAQQKEIEDAKKAKEAQRAHEFADYVIADVREYAFGNKTKQAVREAVAIYEYDPKFWNGYIQELVADSTKYANAIVRDSWVINKLSPTISFHGALKWVDDQSALVVGPKYRAEYNMGCSHGEEVIASVDYVPTGETEVKGSNKSAEYKMKVNRRHLKEISTKLAIYKAAQNQAHKNQGR